MTVPEGPIRDDNQALTRIDQARAVAEVHRLQSDELLGSGVGALLHDAVSVDPFRGAGRAPFTREQQAVLGRALSDQEIHIRPDDGHLYFPGVYYRRRLNEAFGMGGWAVIPVGEPRTDNSGRNPTVYYTGRLYVLGRFAAEATGTAMFISNNPKSNYGTALESARTDCLTRAAKDWIATELWDPDFSNVWRAQHCQRIKNPDPGRFGTAVMVWVKSDDPMFTAEATVPVQARAPNVPVPPTDKETGQPIMGMWPQYVPEDPSKLGERRLYEDYCRAVGAVPPSDLEVQLQKSIDANTIEVIDKKTGVVTRETKATSGQIARIHILVRETGYSDEAYREGMRKKYFVSTSALLTKAQAEDMILRLERTKSRVPAEMLRVVPDAEKGDGA